MQNYNASQGLALATVTCSCMDKYGNLSFGPGGGGVSRYDGRAFTNYTTEQGLANNRVWSILNHRKGNLWFGMAEGILRLDRLRKFFTTYPPGGYQVIMFRTCPKIKVGTAGLALMEVEYSGWISMRDRLGNMPPVM